MFTFYTTLVGILLLKLFVEWSGGMGQRTLSSTSNTVTEATTADIEIATASSTADRSFSAATAIQPIAMLISASTSGTMPILKAVAPAFDRLMNSTASDDAANSTTARPANTMDAQPSFVYGHARHCRSTSSV